MRGGERGYALLLAIVVVVVLSMATLAAARVFSDASILSARLRAGDVDAVRAETLMARAAFLLMTRESDGAAVSSDAFALSNGGAVPLDGSPVPVAATADAWLAVQDEAGLFNLNAADQEGLAALLALAGIERGDRLAATLMDYVDGDDLVREGGAERRQYEDQNLMGPADAALTSRWQALEALGWRTQRLEGAQVWSWVTSAAPESRLNLNTAPQPVLEAVLADGGRARAVVDRRSASAITDMAEVETLTAGASRATGVTFTVTPGRVFRVQAVFGSQRAPHGIERRLALGDAETATPFKWIEERELRSVMWQDGNGTNGLSLGAPSP